ncbi:ABC-2 type transport system ATP-binding protein [Brevibacterium siliguriense]|uniref:ABC-2 type transport system ATP-binding protein n=1 Tax=Brevibacterium siliguriense TaxID=1136497 RepID=A0A1H1LKY5_9MICO|nr:ATP-binding cassette domain-containing protein [Brevibacterium siliguriense]SDR75194.1 ABC-2 type transport system ATP-binding protein [Brevibacterium siliguriense]
MNVSSSSDEGISVRGLTKSYGGLRVVDDLSFDVEPGQVTGFLGPNGAGKSTTLQMILGLTSPDSGTAAIHGRPLPEHAEPARIAGAFLGAEHMLPGLTARGHLDWIATATGTEPARIDEMLELVDLTRARSRRISQLSLGMRQRLGIAAALLTDPDVLILDEPLNGLDPAGITWLRTLLTDVASTGRTVLLSSHLLREMELIAHHVIIIRDGLLIADRPLDALRRESSTRVQVQGTDLAPLLDHLRAEGWTVDADEMGAHAAITGIDPGEIFRLCVRLGVELTGLAAEEPDLEDAFLGLTDTGDDRHRHTLTHPIETATA